MLLKELSPGTKGTIVGYDKKAPEYRRRLLMLGAYLSDNSTDF